MSQATVEARCADPRATRVLEAVAALWGRLERRLFQALHRGGERPSKERIAQVKRAFIAGHGLSARQFNGLRINLEGKVEAWREVQNERLAQLGESHRKLQKRIGKLEAARKRLTRQIAAFKPSGEMAAPQAFQNERRRVAFQLHQKKRRLHLLETKRRAVAASLRQPPAICFGGRGLFRKQFHLEANGFASHEAWSRAWRERRSSQFYAVGSGDEKRGNGECQFDPDTGTLRLRLPNALAGLGKHLWMNLDFHRSTDLLASLVRSRAISYRFLRRANGRWYVQATTLRDPAPVLTRRELGAIGADLNADHIAVADLDRFGNLAGHRAITLDLRGLTTAQAKARIGDALADLVGQAKAAGKPLVMEALDFRKKKAALRELGKPRARMLSAFAFAQVQAAAASRCAREGVELLREDPAYTSIIGYAKFGASYQISSHVAAAMAIGRRGLGFGERLSARSASPRLGEALDTRLREIAKSRKAGEHVWKSWQSLTSWLRLKMREHRRPRSVLRGGASHPGGAGPPSVTAPSSGCQGVRTPAAPAVGTAALAMGRTKNLVNQGFCS